MSTPPRRTDATRTSGPSWTCATYGQADEEADHRRDADEQRGADLDVAERPVGERRGPRRENDRGERRREGERASNASSPISRHHHDAPADPEERAKSPATKPIQASGRIAPGPWRGAGSVAVTAPDRRLRDALALLRPRLSDAALFCDFDGTLARSSRGPRMHGCSTACGGIEDLLAGRGCRVRERARPGRPGGPGRHPGCAYAATTDGDPPRRPRARLPRASPTLATSGAFRRAGRHGSRRRPADGGEGGDPERPRPRRPTPTPRADARADRLGRPRSWPGADDGPGGAGGAPAGGGQQGSAVRLLLRDSGARVAMYIGDDRTTPTRGGSCARCARTAPSMSRSAWRWPAARCRRRPRGGRRGGAGPAGGPQGAAPPGPGCAHDPGRGEAGRAAAASLAQSGCWRCRGAAPPAGR